MLCLSNSMWWMWSTNMIGLWPETIFKLLWYTGDSFAFTLMEWHPASGSDAHIVNSSNENWGMLYLWLFQGWLNAQIPSVISWRHVCLWMYSSSDKSMCTHRKALIRSMYFPAKRETVMPDTSYPNKAPTYQHSLHASQNICTERGRS